MSEDLRDSEIDEIKKEICEISPEILNDSQVFLNGFLCLFEENLCKYTEYSFTPYDKSLGLMTRGRGGEYIGRVKEYLAQGGMNPHVLELFETIASRFDDIFLMIKSDFNGKENLFDFSIYWQILLPMETIPRISGLFHIPRKNLIFLQELSLLLRSSQLYLGLEFSPPHVVAPRVFFQNSLEESRTYLSPALGAVLTRVGIGAQVLNYFIGYHNYLLETAKGSLFTSLDISGELKGIKLDYEIIPFSYLDEIMKSLGISGQERIRAKDVMDSLQMENATYLGIKYLEKFREPVIKFYFDRRFSQKNRDNPEILAEFLQNTIWRFS